MRPTKLTRPTTHKLKMQNKLDRLPVSALTLSVPYTVIPAKAGIHLFGGALDSRMRGNDRLGSLLKEPLQDGCRSVLESSTGSVYYRQCSTDMYFKEGRMSTTKIFSADSHVVEPADVWTARIEARFRDRAPHIVKEANGVKGDFFVCEGLSTLR